MCSYVTENQAKELAFFESSMAGREGVSVEAFRAQREAALKLNKEMLQPDRIMVLADELSDDDSKESDAESQKSSMVFDFSKFQFQLGKTKEVYRRKPLKFILTCDLCRTLYDYNKACAHYSIGKPDQLQEELGKTFNDTSLEINQMHQRLFKSLDVLSTFKVTALPLTQMQFNELFSMFISKDSIHLLEGTCSNIDVKSCPKCADLLEVKDISPPIIALRVLCRSLTFQVETIMTNDFSFIDKTKDKISQTGHLQPSASLVFAVFQRFMSEINIQSERQAFRFELLYLLCRALCNLLLLSSNQS